jgi:hypothetical protein
MLGSLDRTARRHHVTLTWNSADADSATQANSDESDVVSSPMSVRTAATRQTVSSTTAFHADLCPRKTLSGPQCALPTSPNELRVFEDCSSGRSLTMSDGLTDWLDSTTVPDGITAAGAPFAESADTGKAEVTSNRRPLTFVRSDAENGPRRFTVPLFTATGVSDRTLLLHEIGYGDKVRVYATARGNSAAKLARAVVERLERRLIRFVETHVGTLADSDRDGYLTVVLSQLETQAQVFTGGEPVRGCVRAADVLAPGDNGGDIIYLSETLPVDDELDSILAHEVTHLAVLSMLCGSAEPTQLPGWLNEAVAHYVECLVDPDSRNMATRLEEFRRRPAEFPVVVPDHHASLSLRRGPSRAAGCLFLTSVLSRLPQNAVHDVIAGSGGAVQRLEHVTGRSFGELFREWGLQMIDAGDNLPRWQVINRKEIVQRLTGTALSWSAPVKCDGTLTITSSGDCRLQVTVLSGDGDRPGTWQD